MVPCAQKNCNEARASRPNTLPTHRQCRPSMPIVANQMTRLGLSGWVARRRTTPLGASTQAAIVACGILQLHKPQGTCLEGPKKTRYPLQTHTHTLVHTHTHTHTRTHTHTPHTLANSEQLSSRPMDGHRGIVELLVETLGKLRRCHLNGLAQPGKRRPTL